MRRVIGTVGLVVATTGQPTVGDVVDHAHHPPERHDHTEAEGSWTVPVRGPVDLSDLVAGPVALSVSGVGSWRAGSESAGTMSVTIRELGEVGEVFHLTEIELAVLTDGVTFVGPVTLTSEIPCAGRVSPDGRRLIITTQRRGRRVPWMVTASGVKLAADRELPGRSVVRLEVAIRSPRRMTRQVRAGSPGTVV